MSHPAAPQLIRVGRRWYQHVREGEWVTLRKRGYRLGCCDCGLVHRHNYRVRADGTIQFQAFRDDRQTRALQARWQTMALHARALRARQRRAR